MQSVETAPSPSAFDQGKKPRRPRPTGLFQKWQSLIRSADNVARKELLAPCPARPFEKAALACWISGARRDAPESVSSIGRPNSRKSTKQASGLARKAQIDSVSDAAQRDRLARLDRHAPAFDGPSCGSHSLFQMVFFTDRHATGRDYQITGSSGLLQFLQ